MENITSVTIETPSGSKTLSVCCGDISSWEKPLDVMTVSAFAGHYSPVPQTVIEALKNQGIFVPALAVHPELDLRRSSHVWLSEQIQSGRLPISRIGCIEMRQLGRHISVQESDILSAIRAYFRMLDLASVSGIKIRTLALPILGTGKQALTLELIAPPVISECLRYLRLNEDIQEISIFARSDSKAYRMAKALASSYTLVRSRNEKPKQPGGGLPLAFISYAGADRNVADNLCAKLEAAGIPVWYAPRNVDTNDYASSIVSAISRCSHFIVIVSRNSLQSEHVLNEVDLAFEELGRKIRLCPLKLDGEQLGPAFKYYLSRQHWMEASLPPLEARLTEFVAKLRRELSDG